MPRSHSESSNDIVWELFSLSVKLYSISKCILPNEITLHRGSYMSAHVLLNLLNKLGKRDKIRGLPSILSLFHNEFDKFNKARARMLDSIYHMTLRLVEISFLS